MNEKKKFLLFLPFWGYYYPGTAQIASSTKKKTNFAGLCGQKSVNFCAHIVSLKLLKHFNMLDNVHSSYVLYSVMVLLSSKLNWAL